MANRARHIVGSVSNGAMQQDGGQGSCNQSSASGVAKGGGPKSDGCESAKRERGRIGSTQAGVGKGKHGAERQGCSGIGGEASTRVHAGAAAGGASKDMMTDKEKQRIAQKMMEKNCRDRLGLSWEEFLSKFKQSNADERKDLYDSIK